MRHPAISPLLILQDRDQTRRSTEAQLKAVPGEVALVEGRIAAERRAIEDAKAEVKELETKRKGLEGEIAAAEAKLAKYRTQQAAVRKNDEYQALGHEIETVQAVISELEGRELEVMFAIDAARDRFAAAEAQLEQNISGHQARLEMLAEREARLRAELAEVEEAVAAAREPVLEPARRLYDRVAARYLPAVVPIRDGKCVGCHLKVSGEIDAEARKAQELVTCDHCGRILWWESA